MKNFTIDNYISNRDIDNLNLGIRINGRRIKLLKLLKIKSILRKRTKAIPLEDISKDFNITRERVRQYEKIGVNLILNRRFNQIRN